MTQQEQFAEFRAAARNEAHERAARTGTAIDVREELTALSTGGVKQVYSWKAVTLAVNDAVQAVLQAGAVPYCDDAGVLRLRVPWPAGDKRVPRTWPIRAWETEAWIARVVFQASRRPLARSEMREALQILEGLALETQPEQVIDDMFEDDPLLDFLYRMVRRDDWSGTATDLLKDLEYEANRRHYDFAADPTWPTNGAHLGVRLMGRSG